MDYQLLLDDKEKFIYLVKIISLKMIKYCKN